MKETWRYRRSPPAAYECITFGRRLSLNRYEEFLGTAATGPEEGVGRVCLFAIDGQG